MSKKEFAVIQTKRFYRAKELAKHLGIGISSVWKLSKDGKIIPHKISSRTTVFDIVEVEKALFDEV